jgi:hypothetical protein
LPCSAIHSVLTSDLVVVDELNSKPPKNANSQTVDA